MLAQLGFDYIRAEGLDDEDYFFDWLLKFDAHVAATPGRLRMYSIHPETVKE